VLADHRDGVGRFTDLGDVLVDDAYGSY